MKHLFSLLALLVLSTWAQGQCAPPNYCGSTSLAVAALPTAPNVGQIKGAGATFTDPIYGTKGVRLTDACFDPSMVKASAACPNGTNSADNANNSYSATQTGSADDLEYNTGDFLTIVANQGGRHYLVGFDKNTLALSRPYSSLTSGCPHDFPNCHNTGGWATADGLDESLGDPCKVFSTSGTNIISYTFGSDVVPFANPCSAGIVGPPAAVPVVNLVKDSPAGCSGTACNGLPSDFGSQTWTNSGGESVGDTLLVRAFSSVKYHVGSTTGQGTGFYIVIYSPTKGLMSYNTSTGAIHADIGWAGGAGLTCSANSCSGTSTAGSTFTLHNVKMNKSGTAIMVSSTTNISGTACSAANPWIWVPGTTTVYCAEGQPGVRSSGHAGITSQGILNDSGSPLYQFWYRLSPATGPAGSPATVNNVPSSPACNISADEHISYQSADPNDTWPFLGAFNVGSTSVIGLPPFDPFPCAWINELVMFDMNGDRLAHRMAFTFNTGWSIYFNSANGITELSPSGRFASAGSDWLNSLRNTAGSAPCNGILSPSTTCIPNGPGWFPGKAFPLGYFVNPSSNNAGNFTFQVIVPGVSGATAPVWSSTNCNTVGGTCTDGTVTWKNIGSPVGVNAPGTDAFMWDLQSMVAQIAPPSGLAGIVR